MSVSPRFHTAYGSTPHLPVAEEEALIHELEALVEPGGRRRVVGQAAALAARDGALHLAEAAPVLDAADAAVRVCR